MNLSSTVVKELSIQKLIEIGNSSPHLIDTILEGCDNVKVKKLWCKALETKSRKWIIKLSTFLEDDQLNPYDNLYLLRSDHEGDNRPMRLGLVFSDEVDELTQAIKVMSLIYADCGVLDIAPIEMMDTSGMKLILERYKELNLTYVEDFLKDETSMSDSQHDEIMKKYGDPIEEWHEELNEMIFVEALPDPFNY